MKKLGIGDSVILNTRVALAMSEALEKVAAERGIKRSELVRTAIAELIARERAQRTGN